jgi:hypothetical protein
MPGPACSHHAQAAIRPRSGGVEFLDLDILEPDFHRLWPNVDLERVHPVLVELRVSAVDDPCAIQVDPHVRTWKGKEMDG